MRGFVYFGTLKGFQASDRQPPAGEARLRPALWRWLQEWRSKLASGRHCGVGCTSGDLSPPPGGTAATAPPPPLGPPPGGTGGVPLCSGDVDGAGLPTLVAPPELWVGSGVGAGDGSEVELGAVGDGGGGTGGGPLECPPGIGGFVADGVGVQLQVSSGEDGGSLGVGGDEVSHSVDVGCSLGVGCPVSDAVGVGDGSLVEGAGSELDGGVG